MVSKVFLSSVQIIFHLQVFCLLLLVYCCFYGEFLFENFECHFRKLKEVHESEFLSVWCQYLCADVANSFASVSQLVLEAVVSNFWLRERCHLENEPSEVGYIFLEVGAVARVERETPDFCGAVGVNEDVFCVELAVCDGLWLV